VGAELRHLIKEAEMVIKESLRKTDKPLAVQFSGGRDSMAMLSLVRDLTDNFFPAYMDTGIEFPESLQFARTTAEQLGFRLLVSTPDDHLGGFFERLPHFGWPTIHSLWCNRDLKVRPQKKILDREFGRGTFYKMVGVRKFESSRRLRMHREGRFFARDYQVGVDVLAYPMLNWEDHHVLEYLEAKRLPTSSLYNRYGVSGCYWCPFYQADIYRSILRDQPALFDRFIEAERIHGPSVNNYTYLGEIKKAVLEE
jgi:phosphoadenosine phosphosulfate reductase